MLRSRSLVSAGALGIAAAVLASSLAAGPAHAAPGELTSTEQTKIRATMRAAGVSAAVEDRLIAKLQTGDQLDSELDTVVPVSSLTTTEAAGVVTTRTFPDGSIRTTIELDQNTTAASSRGYVAHPTLECNLIHCTLIYSRADTRYMATGSFATVSAMIAAACGPAAWACGIAVGTVFDTTKRAYNSGRCIALQKVIAAGPAYPVIATCRK